MDHWETGGVDTPQGDLRRSVALLAKAERTPERPEAIALVLGCYRSLARVINAYDDEAAAAGREPRRRERRLLSDRRADRRSRLDGPPDRPADPVKTFASIQQLRAGDHRHVIDLRA